MDILEHMRRSGLVLPYKCGGKSHLLQMSRVTYSCVRVRDGQDVNKRPRVGLERLEPCLRARRRDARLTWA